MSIETAVLSVKSKGRKPTVLPSGKTLAEAKAEATQAVRDAKTTLSAARNDVAIATKRMDISGRTATKALETVAVAEAQLKACKAAVPEAKEAAKQATAASKQAFIDLTASTKAAENAEKAWNKATEALKALTTPRKPQDTGG